MVYAVNDGAVMTGWAKDQGTMGSMLKLLGDPRSEFTNALGLVLDHPGPMSVLGNPRCKRFSMFVDNCVIKSLNVAEGPDDPAGDNAPEVSMVDKMLGDVKTGAVSGAARPPPFAMAQPPRLSPASFKVPSRPLGASRLGTFRAPRSFASRPMAQQISAPRMQYGPRLIEQTSDATSTSGAWLVGLSLSGALAFAVVRKLYGSSTARDYRLLAA